MTPRPGQSLGGRPVTEIVTPVNMGNQPHCDNGEGVAPASPLPSRLNAEAIMNQRQTVSFSRPLHGLQSIFASPSDKSLGYSQSSAKRGLIPGCSKLILFTARDLNR